MREGRRGNREIDFASASFANLLIQFRREQRLCLPAEALAKAGR